MRSLRWILLALLLLAAFATGWWLSRKSVLPAFGKPEVAEEGQLLLERIRKVARLVTVEGHLNEIYSYKDYVGYDIPLFQKKALLRVRARVSVGYDLDRVSWELRPDTRTVILSGLPEPEILSLDHELDYYDLSEGVFNTFDEADYNRLQSNAKSFIREKATTGPLMESAREQGLELLQAIRFMVEGAGWQLKVEGEPIRLPARDARGD